ncbi:hypothetical protein FQZ97_892280 [compost metagenome]
MFPSRQIFHETDEKAIRFAGAYDNAGNFGFAERLKRLKTSLATDDFKGLSETVRSRRHRNGPLEPDGGNVFHQLGENLLVTRAGIEHADLLKGNQADRGCLGDVQRRFSLAGDCRHATLR